MAVIREQAKAGEEVRLQREEEERAERRARAVEASQERMRRLMGGGRRRSRERRDPSTAEGSGSRSRHHASTSRSGQDWRHQDDSDDADRHSDTEQDLETSQDTYLGYSPTNDDVPHRSAAQSRGCLRGGGHRLMRDVY